MSMDFYVLQRNNWVAKGGPPGQLRRCIFTSQREVNHYVQGLNPNPLANRVLVAYKCSLKSSEYVALLKNWLSTESACTQLKHHFNG